MMHDTYEMICLQVKIYSEEWVEDNKRTPARMQMRGDATYVRGILSRHVHAPIAKIS